MDKLKVKKIFAIKLRDYGLAIERDWYIEYKKLNESGEIVKRQYRGDINKYATVPERQAEVTKILDYIALNNTIPPKRPGSRLPISPILSKHSFFDSLADDFLEYKNNRVRHNTYQNYRYVLQSFSYFLQRNNLEACKIEHVGEAVANKYINSIDLSNNSKNKHLTICKQVFNFAIKRKLIKTNPFLNIEGFPKVATPPAAFNKKQREKLKQSIQRKDPQLWEHCMFMFYTFIRPGELRKLRIENIYLDENKIEIPATVSKNKKLQFVQIPKQLKHIIKNMELDDYSCDYYLFSSNGKPGPIMLGQNNIRTRFSNFLKALNFSSRYKLYSWKHTGVAECARAGLNLKDIQMQLRHHSLEMTDQYLKSLGVMDNERIRNKFPDL